MAREQQAESTGRAGMSRLTVYLPLAVGLAVRLVGVRHGEPDSVYHPDVAKQILVAQAVSKGNPDTRRLFGSGDVQRCLYPYGMAVMLGRSARLLRDLAGIRIDHVHRFYWALAMRYLVIALFLAATLSVLLCLRARFGTVAAVTTGFLLCLEPVGAQFGHYGMNDVPLLCLLLPAWICTAFMPGERPHLPVFSALSGLCAGLAFGVKYQGVLGLIFPGVAGLILLRGKGWQWALAAGASAAAGFLGGVLATTPMLLKAPAYFADHFPEFMQWQANILQRNTPVGEKLPRNAMACFVLTARNNAWLLPALGAAAVVAAWKRGLNPSARILVTGAASFCLVLAAVIVTSRDIIRANDLIPVFGFLCILPGLLLVCLPRPARANRSRLHRAVLGIAGVVTAAFLTVSVLDARALAREDTRRLAGNWCRRNIPPGATVVRERYTCRISKEGVKEHAARYLCEPAARAYMDAGSPDYVITSSLANERFFDRWSAYYDEEAQALYRNLGNRYRPLAVFRDRQLIYAQPALTIYGRRGAL